MKGRRRRNELLGEPAAGRRITMTYSERKVFALLKLAGDNAGKHMKSGTRHPGVLTSRAVNKSPTMNTLRIRGKATRRNASADLILSLVYPAFMLHTARHHLLSVGSTNAATKTLKGLN